MPRIRILPLEQTVEAEEGETLMEAAWRHGLYWPTTCGGQGICTSCACTIEEGAESLGEMGRSEQKTLVLEMGEAAVRGRALRLACQARVYGDVTVVKRGVRPARPSALSIE
jgi:2Fe-2S ferredoxin